MCRMWRFLVLYPWELELGFCWRPSGCLVEGSVRTLKNYFKTTCWDFWWCIWEEKFNSEVLSMRVVQSVPPRDLITLLYIWFRKVSCENCTSVSGVAVWSYWLKFLIISWKLHLFLTRHMNVIASHVLFSPLKRTKYHSSTPGIERLIS